MTFRCDNLLLCLLSDAGRQLHRHNCFSRLVDLLVGIVKWRNIVQHCRGITYQLDLQMHLLISSMPWETLRVSRKVENSAISRHTILSV